VSRQVDQIREHAVLRRHGIDEIASNLVAGNRSPADHDLELPKTTGYVLLTGAWLSLGTLHVPGANRLMIAQALINGRTPSGTL
jgi:hypothetical protein